MKKLFLLPVVLAFAGATPATATDMMGDDTQINATPMGVPSGREMWQKKKMQQPQSMQKKTVEQSEAEGYSLSFIAYHYNQACNLGLGKGLIDMVLAELKKAEEENRISQQTINENLVETNRLYKENPTKFCEDAEQIATTLKTIFMQQ
jgi:hypothetical protein